VVTEEVPLKRRVDLIDQFAELVVGADDPRRLADRTLEVIMSLSNGRSGAVFSREGDQLALFASRGIDQAALSYTHLVWGQYRDSFLAGVTFYVPDRTTDRRITATAENERVEAAKMVALLYVDSGDPHFCESHDLIRLTKFSRILSKAIADSSPERQRAAVTVDSWETYLERTPVDDMEREKLLLLLNRNEWNIARVSRLMGVTRRTIYLRLQRYNIPRERVPKTRRRTAQAPS
jgi:hypothetical protein